MSDRLRLGGAARRSDRRRALAALAVAALGALPLGAQGAGEPDAALAAGAPLDAALGALAARGVPLVWSTLVVRPELVVLAPPAATAPRAQLDQLLAPHGLVAVAGAGGSLVVQAASATARPAAALAGEVRARGANVPLGGVALALEGTAREAVTGADGRFAFAEVEPGLHALEARRPGFVVERFAGVVARPGETTRLLLLLQPAPFAGEEIEVHPSRATLLAAEPVAPVELARDEIAALPHLGDDLLRALELLPGVASNDLTAQFHVRGGRRDEVLLLLDGQEIYEGFHLKDFDGALSLFAASGLDRVDLVTGAFAADSGDRMGGVLELASAERFDAGSVRIAATALTFELGAARAFPGGRGRFFVQARRGTSELVDAIFDRDQPEFADLFARADADLSERSNLRLHFLGARDRFDLVEGGSEEPKHLETAYDSSYLWATHQRLFGARLFVDSAVSRAASDRDRRDAERDGEKDLLVVDRRASRVDGVRQQWNAQLGERQFAKLGGGFRRFATRYDYTALRAFDTPLARLRPEPREGLFRYEDRLVDEQLELYLSDRIEASDRLTLELGLRYDRARGARREAAWSPRLNLAFAAGARSLVRLGWGRYLQGHRTYELMVEDGDVARYPFERSEHRIAGFERRFETETPAGVESLRIELFDRPVARPRPRYESLFEPFDPFPEGELDRHRFAPERSRARGVELFLRGRLGERAEGWLSYTLQEVADTIGGERVHRSIDQRHTLNLDLAFRPRPEWSVNLAGLFHTGRPTTSLAIVTLPPEPGPEPDQGEEGEEGEPIVVPVLGPLHAERLGDYHRLDLRVARVVARSWGRVTLFGDVQNLFARANQAGVDYEYDDESGELVRAVERWPGLVASAGVVFEF